MMHGTALASFLKKQDPVTWPFLKQLITRGYFSYADYFFAEKLLSSLSTPIWSEELLLLLCYLFLSSREGHLCIHIEEDQISPALERAEKLMPDEKLRLEQSIKKGLGILPPDLFEERGGVQRALYRLGNVLYLYRSWLFETVFLKQVQQVHLSQTEINLDRQALRSRLDQLLGQHLLLEEQSDAIWKACTSSLTLITGGPGTGKTYTVSYLIELFFQSISSQEREHVEVAIAAPTGKATARLKESLLKGKKEDFFPDQLAIKTLHSLLGIQLDQSDELMPLFFPKLSADLVIVDESSMIDLTLMVRLLSALKPGAKLVLIGDKDQLPPVGSGSLFADLISYNERGESSMAIARLSKCMRSDLQPILNFAAAVNRGKSDEALAQLKGEEAVGPIVRTLLFEEKEGVEIAQKALVKMAMDRFATKKVDPVWLLTHFNAFRMLSPLRKGPLGVDFLNEMFAKEAKQRAWKDRRAAALPIMITANASEQDLYNGEVGVLLKRPGGQEEAFFPDRSSLSTSYRRISRTHLPAYEYAYCLSVHKSQGSEFDEVLLIMPEGSEVFGREVLYTAVTRARLALHIYAQDKVLKAAIEKQGRRLSSLRAAFDFNLRL